MTVVLLGGNRFEECDSVLSFRGVPLLRVLLGPLRIQLTIPEALPLACSVRVDENERFPPDKIYVVSTPRSFAIFWEREHALAISTLVDDNTAHLRVDLRPLGINIHDEADGLHIGGNTFARNVISRSATAINLG
jgi:hypothetical protein